MVYVLVCACGMCVLCFGVVVCCAVSFCVVLVWCAMCGVWCLWCLCVVCGGVVRRPTIQRKASRHRTDNEQLRALLASPLYVQEREASAERSQVSHSERENLISSSSQDPISTGKLVTSQNWLNQETFTDREDFPFLTSTGFLGAANLSSDSLTPASVARSLLDGNRDHLLAEARSELTKQEYKVEYLNSCMSELEQQTCAQRLKLENAPFRYGESRREQVRLQEELVMKEKALRDTQIRSIHEMRELKRAQELRIDEFSAQKLRESHDTIQKLTSQIQELRERANCMNDSGEFQYMESNYSGNISHVPSQPAVVPIPRSMLSRDRSMPFDTWNLSETQGNVFWQSTSHVRFNTDSLSRNSSLNESKCHGCDSSAGEFRATCREK